jgi:hydrogenase nickel incorporation protein HypB
VCATCGCGQGDLRQREHAPPYAHDPDQGHGHGRLTDRTSHTQGHDHAPPACAHTNDPASNAVRVIEIGRALLAENDRFAAQNRSFFDERGARCFNLISSPGAGKTTLLENTLVALRNASVPCAVIEGDQATDLDAQRIARTGVPVFQIETGRSCHLDARQVHHALGHLQFPPSRLLFIENVGNLICPTEFALGEHDRVTILSVAEGGDKPAKYPLAFSSASAVVISKLDLLPYVDFDLEEAKRVITGLNPKAPIFELSARTGVGMQAWLLWLRHTSDVPA